MEVVYKYMIYILYLKLAMCTYIDTIVVLLQQKSLTVTGPELLTAILDFVRNNDIAIGEECDKVRTHNE